MRTIDLGNYNEHDTIKDAAAVLAAGGLVVFPTETMYGVAVDATNAAAVTKLLRYKRRPAGKPVSVLVANEVAAERVVQLGSAARHIFATFLPGPVTVVANDHGVVDSRLISELGTLGVRISSHPFAQGLAEEFGKPLTATSANASGQARPYDIPGLLARLSPVQQAAIDLIVDAGPLPRREPSTVIDTTQDAQTILRSGELVTELAEPFISHSEAETRAHAARLVDGLRHVLPEKPLIFALEGEMGMGKTQFAKGVAEALGVTQVVSSPTYVLVKEYPLKNGALAHFDLWRLETASPDEMGLEDYLLPGSVVVIEWAAPLLPYLRSLGERAVVQRLLFAGDSERTIKRVAL